MDLETEWKQCKHRKEELLSKAGAEYMFLATLVAFLFPLWHIP